MSYLRPSARAGIAPHRIILTLGRMSHERDILPIIPLRSVVLFPGVVLSLELGGTTGIKLADEIRAGRAPRVLTVPLPADDAEVVGAVGAVGEVMHLSARAADRVILVIRGSGRR